MISLDGQRVVAVPYMPINQVAVDDDDPANQIALMSLSCGQRIERE